MIGFKGDMHGDVITLKHELEILVRKEELCNTTFYLFLLGDAGINYHLDERDLNLKRILQSWITDMKHRGIDIYLLFVRGNHEARPEQIPSYTIKEMFKNEVYVEDEFAHLIFLKDGALYEVENKKFLILGGGNSRDYLERILGKQGFWNREELGYDEVKEALEKLSNGDDNFYVCSHMVPKSLSPRSNDRDTTTELVLELLYERLKGKLLGWYSGHYHIERRNNLNDSASLNILYRSILLLEQGGQVKRQRASIKGDCGE